MISKAQRERLWLLERHWGRGGWSICVDPTKKAQAAISALVRRGLLEASGPPDDDSTMWRITTAGRAALEQEGQS